MLDYILFVLLFQYKISALQISGSYFISNNIRKLMSDQKVLLEKNSQLILIYKQNFNEIFNLLNSERETVDWVIINLEENENVYWLYSQLRNCADDIFFHEADRIIILKNFNKLDDIHENVPFAKQIWVDDFLKTNILEKEEQFEASFDEWNLQIAKCLLSNCEFFYFGEEISDKDLLKCQMFAKMNFKIIECFHGNEKVGYFVHYDYKKNLLIHLLANSAIVKNILHIENNKISIPVNLNSKSKK
jgi:hypothetical protein